ncbi:hypothetical protein CYMTET_30133 [Cymbomonas tetramitiformis]|uniref:Uncharacterized protein n=1 Tax=Cymbomonas tetramitiformis TaxID=36881 RepID=A0AAE0FJV1_9CHLO|nr:hypothetical protein CYMTET_30133 [Cymbomonas tetramitiformis]
MSLDYQEKQYRIEYCLELAEVGRLGASCSMSPPLQPPTTHESVEDIDSQEPEPEPVKQVKEVRVRCIVKKVINVDLVAQTFKLWVFLEASWVDIELLGKTIDNKNTCSDYLRVVNDTEGKGEDNAKHYFAPRLSFMNLISVDDNEQWWKLYDADVTPVVCFRGCASDVD